MVNYKKYVKIVFKLLYNFKIRSNSLILRFYNIHYLNILIVQSKISLILATTNLIFQKDCSKNQLDPESTMHLAAMQKSLVIYVLILEY